MAKQTRQTNPGDAANAFVRVILSDAGAMLGGLKEDEWRKTLDWFDGRCAYTGQTLAEGETQRDHAIPINRTHCGLHLYGNVVPATEEANRRKAGSHYREFLEDGDELERIDAFLRESGYWEQVATFGNLQNYCEGQYRAIDGLCRVNRQYLSSLLPSAQRCRPSCNRLRRCQQGGRHENSWRERYARGRTKPALTKARRNTMTLPCPSKTNVDRVVSRKERE